MVEKIKIFLADAVRRVDWVLLLCTTVLSTVSLPLCHAVQTATQKAFDLPRPSRKIRSYPQHAI